MSDPGELLEVSAVQQIRPGIPALGDDQVVLLQQRRRAGSAHPFPADALRHCPDDGQVRLVHRAAKCFGIRPVRRMALQFAHCYF